MTDENVWGRRANRKRELFFSLTLWCYSFKAHFTHFCFVLSFNSTNEYLQDLQHVGKNEIMFLKLCRRVQNLIYLRRMYYFSKYLDYWFKYLTHSHWTLFSSGNTSYFHLKQWKQMLIASPIVFYFFLSYMYFWIQKLSLIFVSFWTNYVTTPEPGYLQLHFPSVKYV